MPMSDPSHRPWVLHQLREGCGQDHLRRFRSAMAGDVDKMRALREAKAA